MNFIIFMLLSYGITNIVVFGSIFEPWRNLWDRVNPTFFGKLFNCPLCLSTWIGFTLSLVFTFLGLYTPMTDYGLTLIPLLIFLDGCLTSGVVWLIHTIQEFFEGE
jgi:hypothetical protein